MPNDELMSEGERAVNYFRLFGEEQRPWLDLDALKRKYHELTLASHPDVRGQSSSEDNFAMITEAHRVLTDPPLRLRHLLQLEGVEPGDKQPVPADVAELFPSVAKLVQETHTILTKSAAVSNALSKSLLRAEVANQHAAIKTILANLEQLEDRALRELRDLNDSWHRDRTATLGRVMEIQQRLAYLTRWLQQLREREFQLSVI